MQTTNPPNRGNARPKAHAHEPSHTPAAGTGYQVCRCGATRRIDRGKPSGGWHVCGLCVR